MSPEVVSEGFDKDCKAIIVLPEYDEENLVSVSKTISFLPNPMSALTRTLQKPCTGSGYVP